MSGNFFLFHSPGAGDKSAFMPKGYWHMATCLRSIVISEQSRVPKGFENHEIYEGEGAFEFLLQVICGLHSPMIGETEVLGQFKEFVKVNRQAMGSGLQKIMDQLLKEAKGIRTEYLQNLGCTSYGSLLRKHMKGQKTSMFFIGAGSLAEDILPWFAKSGAPINLFTRRPEKKQNLKELGSEINLQSFEGIRSDHMKGVLVIAAPVSSEWLQEKIQLEQFDYVYDLRGESENDPLPFKNVVPLKTLFADIEANKEQAKQVKQQVQEAIKSSTLNFRQVERPRPFGWDDLWAYS